MKAYSNANAEYWLILLYTFIRIFFKYNFKGIFSIHNKAQSAGAAASTIGHAAKTDIDYVDIGNG